jgi:hypothetical protein
MANQSLKTQQVKAKQSSLNKRSAKEERKRLLQNRRVQFKNDLDKFFVFDKNEPVHKDVTTQILERAHEIEEEEALEAPKQKFTTIRV